MTRQEEIREGLQDWINKYGYSLRPLDLMAWLNSQGVVIKVTQKYPLKPPFVYETLIKEK